MCLQAAELRLVDSRHCMGAWCAGNIDNSKGESPCLTAPAGYDPGMATV
jgi:hypothetical protein